MLKKIKNNSRSSVISNSFYSKLLKKYAVSYNNDLTYFSNELNGADNIQYIEAVNDCSGNTEVLEVINALYKRTEIGDTACFGRHW